MPADIKNKIITAVYSATLPGEDFVDKLQAIDEALFGISPSELDEAYSSLGFANDPDFLMHLQLAKDMQIKFKDETASQSKASLLLGAAPNMAAIINSRAQVIAINEKARAYIKGPPRPLGEALGQEAIDKIYSFIKSSSEPSTIIALDDGGPIYGEFETLLIERLEGEVLVELLGQSPNDRNFFFLTAIDLGFNTGALALFRKRFELTIAEVEVAALIANGKRPHDVAELRDTSLQTVRTQVKSIRRKTNSDDIPQLVRLICGFAYGYLLASSTQKSVNALAKDGHAADSKKSFVLGDGRRLSYLEYGDLTGTPVLVFHNTPYGAEMHQEAIARAYSLGLRIIVPHRSGYSDSDLIPNTNGEQMLDAIAGDYRAVLKKLKISKAILVGQSIGSIFALRFASLFPDQVADFISVSYAPIYRKEYIEVMPPAQRLICKLVQSLPQVSAILLRSMQRLFMRGDAKKQVIWMCRESPGDVAAFERTPEIAGWVCDSSAEALKQGVDQMCREFDLVVIDFCAEARRINRPIRIIHGDADGIVFINRSYDFVDAVPHSTIQVVPGAGQMLIYSHWADVLDAVKHSADNR